MPAHLSLTFHDAVAVLTLQRPPVNALNHALLRELRDVLGGLAATPARALVLAAQGRCFSAGLDLFEVFQYPPDEAVAFSRAFDDAVTALFALELPVVAALGGHAIAGGAVLAAAADFRLLADGDAQLGLTEIRVGVPFPTSAFEIVRCAYQGPYFAELVYRGRTYNATEALARRFVDEVVPPGELTARALALAGELAGRPAIAFSSSKRALRKEALERMAAARAADGTDPLWRHWRSPEVLSAMAAYRGSLRAPTTKG